MHDSNLYHMLRRRERKGRTLELDVLWTDDPYDSGNKQYPVIPAQRKYRTSCAHQNRAKDKDSFATQGICEDGEDETQTRIPNECQCHEKTNFGLRDF